MGPHGGIASPGGAPCQEADRPTSACRDIGPPIASLARRTVGSVQVGMTRTYGVSRPSGISRRRPPLDLPV